MDPSFKRNPKKSMVTNDRPNLEEKAKRFKFDERL